MLTVSSAAVAPTRDRARTLLAAARIATVQGDTAAVRASAQESAAIFRALGNHEATGRVLALQGFMDADDASYEAAQASLEEGAALAEQVGDRWGLAFALGQLGNVAEHESDYPAAPRLREESAAVARAIGDRNVLGLALTDLVQLASLRGEYEATERLFKEALSISAEFGPFWRVIPRSLNGLAGVASLAGDYAGW